MKKNKNILLGVTGGVAAYKAIQLASNLRKKEYNIDVIMTKNACEFLNALSFESIIHKKVITDMFEGRNYNEVEHISLAEKADLILIAPATYNIIGKVASGIADDMLSTVISAAKGKVAFALAMNNNMYDNPILKENIKKLKKLGYIFIDSDSGQLACDTIGKGRLKSPYELAEIADELLKEKKVLKGKKVLITAGPTREAIDPIRFLSNKSTGRMGYSLAEAAKAYGADVELISGPVNLEVIVGVKTIKVLTAQEMYEKTLELYDKSDIIIMTAAVSDYKVKNYSNEKIKKSEEEFSIKFERNPDILFEIGKLKKPEQNLIGFAAESQNLKENAIKKLKNKNLDFIIANDVSNFESNENKIILINKDLKCKRFEKMDKKNLAYKILDEILNI